LHPETRLFLRGAGTGSGLGFSYPGLEVAIIVIPRAVYTLYLCGIGAVAAVLTWPWQLESTIH
jgi:hypothetical protein